MVRDQVPVNGVVAWRPDFLELPGAWLVTVKFDRRHSDLHSVIDEAAKSRLLSSLRASGHRAAKLVGDQTALYVLGCWRLNEAVLRDCLARAVPTSCSRRAPMRWRLYDQPYDGIITRQFAGRNETETSRYNWTFTVKTDSTFARITSVLNSVAFKALIDELTNYHPPLVTLDAGSYRIFDTSLIDVDELLVRLNLEFNEYLVSGVPVLWRVRLFQGEDHPEGWDKLGRQ